MTDETNIRKVINRTIKVVQSCTMPSWYYEKKDLKNTPSIRDGLDYETERRYRKEGARFIMDCDKKISM
ncbi:Cyclin-K [Pseudolycoriella hygida]|uniref:Cyclin-K n=1 Tax=Pseudolycoriella hygida TaxID=35572 RepID=A0A9Q0MV94_9DIPT|nr:Cyclin-K [Pseudolycoriella hygida]